MSATIGNTYKTGVQAYDYQKTQKTKTAEATGETKDVAEAASAKEDAFVKSANYKPDAEKISSMKSDLSKNVSAFKQMVQGLFQKQGGLANNAMNALLNIDKATQDSAKAAISEDGEWGVNATATRILDFAKALSGGDPSKIATLKDAVEKGFAAATKVWGSELPSICQQTYDKIMQGFDEWENPSSVSVSAKA